MERVHVIYEWYDHSYFGFADHNGGLVHFAFKRFLSTSHPIVYLFEVIPARAELLHYTVSCIPSDDWTGDEFLPLWDYMDANKGRVELRKAVLHIGSGELNDPPYERTFIDWMD
ncbi:MAG: hypothetical protein FWH47_02745 [Methanomassiliicoccaceae archaeon]|nr:hypothetical protein [Methanomassiliicoccaceae archaeon]